MREIPLTRGYVALVDDEDYERVSAFKWHAVTPKGKVYAQRNNGREVMFLHQFLTGTKGVDHADGNGLNNQRLNLRKANGSQNQINKPKCKLNPWGEKPSSPYKGVSRQKGTRRWKVRIRKDKVEHHLGYYDDPWEGAQAYNRKAVELYGAFAVLNTPEMGLEERGS